MAEKSAGRVLLIPKGVFTIGTNYTPLDFVAFGSNNYVCKKATDGTKTPVEDTASWQMLAAGFDSHNIAAEYSEEATYHTGDICIRGGNLYKAKQDINAAEAFTAGHWEEITVGQELTSLETTKADASDVTTLKEKVGTTALTTTAADLSGAVNEVKAATDTNASAITKLNSDLSDPDSVGKGNYIGRRVEGGGIIFFDYAIGFKGDVSVAPKTGLNKYHVNSAGIVVKDTTNAADRFYIVQDRDLTGLKDGEQLLWSNGTSGTLYTSLSTSTAFGTGKANTDKAIAAAKTDNLLGWNANAYKCIWHYIWEGEYQYRGWFVPSKDELNVLLNMQWSTASKRLSYDGATQLVQLPMNFASFYWSSSESSATAAFIAIFCNGNMHADGKKDAGGNRVRLVRTF